MSIKFKLLAPFAAVIFLITACQSVPDSVQVSDSTGSSEESAAVISGSSETNVESSSIDADTIETEIDNLDPSAPIPGTQEDLVQNVGDRVFFGLDSALLSPQSRGVLDRQAEWLTLFPDVTITIEGHCDERGTREYNLALGERRAVAARNYLIALGVNADRLSTISYGKERPYGLGHDEDAWSLNRRSVSVIN